MMKKITLLFVFLVASISLNAQTWDFNDGTAQGWEGKTGATLTENPTDVTISWPAGKKPKFQNTNAGVDADANKVFAITLKNNSEVTELKISHPKITDPSKKTFVKITIQANSTEFKTYYIDLTNDEWAGTKNTIEIVFSVAGENTTTDGSLVVDNIEFMAEIPTTEKNSYTFETDGDFEGWTEKNMDKAGTVAGGIYTVTPKADKFAQIIQVNHFINATNNGSFHIILKNESENDKLRIVIPKNDGSGENDIVELFITINDTEEKQYDLDLSQFVGWTGQVEEFKMTFADSTNPNPSQSSATGNLLIQSIIFDNEPILAVENVDFVDDVKISLYPNPTRDVLSIQAPLAVEKVEIYNMLGQKAMSKTDSLKTLNVSRLEKGIYVLKIFQEGNIVSSKRFIKQ